MPTANRQAAAILPHRTRRQFLRIAALGIGAGALQACGGLPGLAPTATPILFDRPTATVGSGSATPDLAATPPAVNGNTPIELRLDYWDSAVRPVIDEFQAQHPDIKIIVPIGESDGLQRSNLASLTNEKSAPDMCAIGLAWLGEYTASGGLLDLSAAPFDAAALKADMVESAWQYGSIEGRQLAIPWLGFPSALFYRADTLKAAGFESEPDALQSQIQRWDDFIDLGVALKAKRSDTTLTADASDLFWLALSQSKSGLIEGNQVLIEEQAERPATLAARTRSEGIDANLQQNAAALAEFRQGRIASVFGTLRFEQFVASQAAGTSGTWRMLAPPEGVGDFGTVFLAIPAQSRHKEQAWAFIQFLAASNNGQNGALKTGAGFPVYKPAWLDPIYAQPHAMFGGQQTLRLWSELIQQMKTLPVSVYDRSAREVIEVELFQILFSKKDPLLAMQDAEKALLRKAEGLRA